MTEETVDLQEAQASAAARVRAMLARPIPGIDTQPPLDGEPDPNADDEIIAALRRQVDAMEGTATALLLLARTVLVQVDGIRAELSLFATPPPDVVKSEAKVEVTRTQSGAIVEASLPEDKRLPGYCAHADALLVDTAGGLVRVCPTCDGNGD